MLALEEIDILAMLGLEVFNGPPGSLQLPFCPLVEGNHLGDLFLCRLLRLNDTRVETAPCGPSRREPEEPLPRPGHDPGQVEHRVSRGGLYLLSARRPLLGRLQLP